MNDATFSSIEQYKNAFDKRILIVRPGVSLTLYSAIALRELAPHVADALQAFLADFPEAKLDAELGTEKYKPLTPSGMSRLLKQSKAIPESYEFLETHLKDGADSQCGRFAFHFEATSLSNPLQPLETNLVVFEWPWEFGTMPESAKRIDQFCRRVAALVPYSAGTCGFAFQHPQTFPTECLNAIQQLMPRYLGFDPSYRRVRFRMRNCLPTVQWITLIGAEMTQQHRELRCDSLHKILPPSVWVAPVDQSVVILAAALPFVGDSNRQAADLGAIPHIARALRPWRYTISGFGGRLVDAEQWLSRFDDR